MPTDSLGPGAFHLRDYLSLPQQKSLLARCRELAAGPVGPYRPTVRGGAKMRLDMLCLGRHWNGLTYRYEPVRSDFDQAAVPPLPADFLRLAGEIASSVGFDLTPDICIMNFYLRDSRLGLHQDKDERPETLAAGIPIVSVSLGDTARFVLGGTRRKDPVEALLLASGDALVLGGPSRLRFHGVTRLLPSTTPHALEIEGRINLTFRKY